MTDSILFFYTIYKSIRFFRFHITLGANIVSLLILGFLLFLMPDIKNAEPAAELIEM